MDIFDVERELSVLIDTDKKAWVQMYLLLDKVEHEKLWKSTHNRFGAWLSHYAKKKNINESLLWHRRQAGRFYSKFAERAALQHHDVTKIEEINIPPDSLNIAERIAAKDDAVADELIGKLLNNEITRQELLSVWGRVKADAKAKKAQAAAPAEAPATPAPAPKEPAPGSAGELKLYDTDPRDAAMIMAIVADTLGKPLNELRFKSIREVKDDEI